MFSVSRPVIIVRAGGEAIKCSLNLLLFFFSNNSKVLDLVYTQQRRGVHNEFNIFLLNIAITVSLLEKNKHMKNAVIFYMLEAKI